MSARDAFYVGYLRMPRPLAIFLCAVCAVLLGAGIGVGTAWIMAEADPGTGEFRWALGEQELTGRLETLPYPVLRLPPDAEHPAGRAMLLVGSGKRGAVPEAAGFDGAPVTAAGVLLGREGAIDMLQLGGPLAAATAASFEPAAAEPLGRWRVAGEIVDGKCYMGAMRPGTGKTHMLCAGLCLTGGIPPLLAGTTPEGGQGYYLLADAKGGPLPYESYADLVSLPVVVEGELERRDALLVLRIDPATLKVGT